MNGVAAGFGNDVYSAAGAAPCLRARLCLCREFVNGVDRHHHARDSRDTALIHCGNVVPEVVVVNAVDLPVDLIGAGSIDRAEAARGITSKARRDADQLREVTPVQWDVLDD